MVQGRYKEKNGFRATSQIITHEGISYICGVCGQTFMRYKYMLQHKKEDHAY